MNSIGTLDFETDAIEPRPKYPPRPVGVALKEWGRAPIYLAWGHPTANNVALSDARRHIQTFVRKHTLLCHHAGFDLDVLATHFGIRWPATHHDSLIMAFLVDPDSYSLSLKPLAQRYLGEPPTEQDAVRDYCLAQRRAKHPDFEGCTEKNFGAYIGKCPGDLIARYAKGDVNRTEALYKHFNKEVSKFPQLMEAYRREIKLTPILVGMEQRGIPIGLEQLEKDLPNVRVQYATISRFLLQKLKVPKKLHDDIIYHYDDQDDFKWSGKGFAEQLLRSKLVKSLPQTGKGNDSTSAESLAMVMPKIIADEFEVRSQLATCINTFMLPWLVQARENDGLFFARYNQVRSGDEWGKKVGARTGRLSMSPNLQNVIRSDKDARVPQLRKYIVKRKRYAGIIKRDYSQQELRDLAHYEDGPFKAAYIANPSQDAHDLVRILMEQTTGLVLSRRPVKDLNFGLIYGQGLPLTAKKMGIPEEDAKRARRAHAASLPGIPALQAKLKLAVANKEPIWTWGGRRYYCEPPALIQGRWRTFEYKMLNKLIQGSAADQTKQAMINYTELGDIAEENPLQLQVHDELLVALLRWREGRRVHEALRDAMMDLPGMSIPMLSDGFISRISWNDMDEMSW